MNQRIYGLAAEFENPAALVAAARAARDRGYRKLDAYSPFHIEGLTDALHLHRNKLPLIVLLGGISGLLIGFFMQYYVAVFHYPLNIGGRPLNSWPSWIPITFEMTVLFAGFTAVIGLFALCGLPMPYHPMFNVPRFELTTRNGFFLCIEATDPLFDQNSTSSFLESLNPKEVSEVAA